MLMSKIAKYDQYMNNVVTFRFSNQSISVEILRFWRQARLKEGGRSTDMDWLLNLNVTTLFSEVILHQDKEITLLRSLNDLTKIWHSYFLQRIPLQYLLGICPWRDLYLKVKPGVLIPRQETELLIDLLLYTLAAQKNQQSNSYSSKVYNWADLGTGSGAIAVALSKALPNWLGHATDYNKEILSQAENNLSQLTSNSSTSIYYGSWFEPLKFLFGKLNLIVANPPYIPSDLIRTLQNEIKDHEPIAALDGGIDGLSAIRILVNTSINMLAPGGLLLMEHHYDQSNNVIKLMAQAGLQNITRACDLEGIQRFAIGRKSLI